ncbi:plasmid mobilization relaxosome protein MobC [Marinobacterium nitratireducens]|nr:plasmid mobilization relaxosome protein MobC [Marinobacterium nitratireducens]
MTKSIAKTRLSEDEKRAWQQFCDHCDTSESEMLRLMILRVCGGTVAAAPVGQAACKSNKITIRLTDRDQRTLMRRAEQEGYRNRTKWTTAVVLSALHREPVLTDQEAIALRESNRQLAAIGRNLNQLARVLNIEFREGDRIKLRAIEALVERIEQHKDKVAALLSRNMNRWSDDGPPGE